jgi:hypothetical protein
MEKNENIDWGLNPAVIYTADLTKIFVFDPMVDGMYLSGDSGVSWNFLGKLSTVYPDRISRFSILYNSDDLLTIVMDIGDFYISVDGGISWSLLQSDFLSLLKSSPNYMNYMGSQKFRALDFDDNGLIVRSIRSTVPWSGNNGDGPKQFELIASHIDSNTNQVTDTVIHSGSISNGTTYVYDYEFLVDNTFQRMVVGHQYQICDYYCNSYHVHQYTHDGGSTWVDLKSDIFQDDWYRPSLWFNVHGGNAFLMYEKYEDEILFGNAVDALSDEIVVENVTEGATTYLACAAGSISSAGSTECSLCAAGRYMSTEGGTACDVVPAGSYPVENTSSSAPVEVGATTYLACPEKWTSSEGATGCDLCAPGYFTVFSGGNKDCTACAAGKFSSNTDSASCDVCSTGTYSPAGSALCTPCNTGFSTTSPGTPSSASIEPAVCTKCANGYHGSPENGVTGCDTCPGGFFTLGSGCSGCPAGSFSSASAAVCTPCPPGSYSSVHAESCIECPAGFYSLQGQGLCQLCPPGSFSSSGASFCSPCPVGDFSGSGASTCQSCSE